MKKILSFMLLLVLIISISTISFATTGITTMEVVEKNVCTIKINDYANFEKKLITENMDKKEVTLQLQIKNTADNITSSADIMFVIDNSYSMISPNNDSITIDGIDYTRQEVVLNSAKTLVSSLFELNSNINIGVVSFSTNGANGGTLNDATLRTSLTNNPTTITNAIDNIAETEAGNYTDLEAGLMLGYSELTKGTSDNKYMIILSDGVPNITITAQTTGTNTDPHYSEEVCTITKNKLEEVGNNVNVISLLTGVSTITGPDHTSEDQTGPTYADYAEKVFGTTSAPTTGKHYFITDNEIVSTITSNIYNDIKIPDYMLKHITIKDYFPAEIVENFNFEYVFSPNIGKVSTTIDTNTNSISWTIAELKPGEIGTLQYNLTLKDNYNKEIVDKILKTNSKVDIEFTDHKKTDTVTSDVSPTVRVHYGEPPTEEPKTPEKRPEALPNAGNTSFIVLGLMGMFFVGVAGFRHYKINKISK